MLYSQRTESIVGMSSDANCLPSSLGCSVNDQPGMSAPHATHGYAGFSVSILNSKTVSGAHTRAGCW